MRIVVQRSLNSRVWVDGSIVGEIDKGLVLLVCIEKGDAEEQVKKAAHKVLKLRCFEDPETGKMSKSIIDTHGEILAISQFTLSWRGSGGNRPGFDLAMEPDLASKLFENFCEILKNSIKVKTGRFGESMKVEISNDGPVTFCLDF
ncbi:MAG: D-tyrosyl-tRNA(Tyr) deacylase [Bacteriovoracaceae bacterium]|nr:D-tyrosyl-tRNA(Tyr) deacylase [Bacteriovoracaceae bacterium]